MELNSRLANFRRAMTGVDALVLLLAGQLYAWSIFVTPLEAEFGWLRAQTSMTYTICVASNTALALLAARIAKKIGPQWVTRIAAVGVLVGFLLASQTQQLWHLYLCYGVMCAGSLGMAYNVILSTIVRWFPEKPGIMSGIMLMCYGLGAMVFGSMISRLIEGYGWRTTFVVLGVICFFVMMVGSIFICNPNAEQAAALPQAIRTADSGSTQNLTPKTMVREKSFWLFASWNLTLATVGLILTSHASPIAEALGLGAQTAALYVGAVSFSNGVSRFVFGMVFDRLGRRKTMLMISCIGLLGGITLAASFSFGWQGVLLVAFVLLGFAFGGTPVSSANFIKSMYGSNNYGENLAFGNLAVLVAAYIGPYFAGLIYQIAGYQLVFTAMIALGVLGVLLGCALYRLRESNRQEESPS